MHSAVTCLRDIFGGGLIRCWATHNILKLLWVPRIYKTQDFPYIKTLYSSNNETRPEGSIKLSSEGIAGSSPAVRARGTASDLVPRRSCTPSRCLVPSLATRSALHLDGPVRAVCPL